MTRRRIELIKGAADVAPELTPRSAWERDQKTLPIDTQVEMEAQRKKDRIMGNMLSAGLSPDRRNCWARTPLHYASYQGNVEAAEMLLAARCARDPRDSGGHTPLHLAV